MLGVSQREPLGTESGSEVSTTSPRGSPCPESPQPGQRYHPYLQPCSNDESAAWRRSRKSRFTDYQQLMLEKVYQDNQYPDYEKIAANLTLTPHAVVYWFQARRRKQAKEKRVLEQVHSLPNSERHAEFLVKQVDKIASGEDIMRLGATRLMPRKRQNPRKQTRPSNIREQRSESASPAASPFQPVNMFQSGALPYPATLQQLAQMSGMSGNYPLLQALSSVQAKTSSDRTDLDALVEQREFLRRMLEHQEMLRYFWDQQLSMIQHLLSSCEARIIRERSKRQASDNQPHNNNNNNNNITPTSKSSTIHHTGQITLPTQPLPAHSHGQINKSPPGLDTVDGTPLMPWDAELRNLARRTAEAAKPRPAHSEPRNAQLALEELSALCAKTSTPYRPRTPDVLDLSQTSQSPSQPSPQKPSLDSSSPKDVPLSINVDNDNGMEAYDFDSMENSMNGDDSIAQEDEQETNNLDALESARRRIRKRTSFSKYQLERLEEEFMTTHYPSSYERETIADALGLNYEQVRIWFKNRRRKEAVLRGMNNFDLKLPHPSQIQVKLEQSVSMGM